MIRPPPGSTPGQSARTSAPQADLITNRTSRGRIGLSTSGAAVVAAFALAPASAAGAVPAVGAAAPPPAAATACAQPAESFDLFFSRHCNAGAPPVGTPAQTFG